MQSFRERCGFHGNQQNYQPSSQDSSRLENYRHQSQPGLNCVRQRQMTKDYYTQTSYQAYENNTGEKYPRVDKHINAQQLQGRVSFASFPEANVYPGQYSAEESLQNWGQAQALSAAKYEENVIKKTSAEARVYQDPSGQIQFRSHALHHPQQASLNYPKIPRQKVQNEVPSSPHPYAQSPHYNQNFPTSTYSSVPAGSPVSHTFKSCTAPSNPPHERTMAAAAAGQRVQAMHGYQASRMGSYDQSQRHHTQESLHYQNMAKYHGQHYSQQGQAYCQPEAPSRTPDPYYQPFSPSTSHSPARSVGRSPSYSSTPSPLMMNLENFQYNQQQQQHNPNTFPMGISDHNHYMPLLNPSPTGTLSPESHTKGPQNDKIPETLLSDLSIQSLTALTTQVENISSTIQQLLLSKSGIPPKKGIKSSPRTPESMKTQHCSSESSAYSSEPMGTPLSETLGTPQSVHAEMQDTDYLSGSEDQLERNYMYCGPGRSPGRANSAKMKPESISTCSVTSPGNLSTKSDDSFQSIHASLPLETFAKLVSSERECPHLLVNALSQEELSTEIIALQDAIDNEKAEKAWADSPELISSPKSPFPNLENHRCAASVAKNTWSDQGASQVTPGALNKVKPDKTPMRNSEFNELPAVKLTDTTEKADGSNVEKNFDNATSSSNYAIYSNTVANSTPRSSDPFEWPDKNMSESCLRWKEIELTLNSDLQKGLFQNKENKVDSQLDVPDVETPLENDSGEEFNKEGAEDLTYTDNSKTDHEKWLEDTRDCYTEDEFQDIPDLPSQKDSNFSSLCDFSERKSIIDDEHPQKQVSDSKAFSSINTPESMENQSAEKDNLVESSQLSDSSIMLLGPTVETESKVNSWFESTLPHIKSVEDTKENNDEGQEAVEVCNESQPEQIDAEKVEVPTLPEKEETVDHQAADEQPAVKVEEPLVKKPQRGRRCKAAAAETKVAEIPVQKPSENLEMIQNEIIETQSLDDLKVLRADKTGVTESTPGRMCTRSSTAKVDQQECGTGVALKPHQEKVVKKGGVGEKERAPSKTGRRGGKLISVPTEQETLELQNKESLVLDTGPKSKEISILKDEQPMILRSRSKKQEFFPARRRRGKRGMNFVLKKRTYIKKIIRNNCTAAETFPIMPKIRKRMKLETSSVVINVKNSERPLHPLKRKSSFIAPVPAKKKNLIIRGKKTKEQKLESPPNLLKKIKPVKKEKVKIKLASKKTCKVILGSPSMKITTDVCLKMAAHHGNLKTKILPPRKGRGLKLEAIVQKMTSPNQKKQGTPVGATVNAGAACNNNLVPLQDKELKENSSVTLDSEARLSQDMVKVDSQKSEAQTPSVSCRGGSRSFKGKCYKKKVNSLQEDLGMQPVAKPEGNCVGSKKLKAVPKATLRRGRSKSSQSTSKLAVKKLLAPTPSVIPTSKDKSLSENSSKTNKCRANESKKLKVKEVSAISETSEEASTQTRAKKKPKLQSFNGYNKKQRKCSSQTKSTSQPPGSKKKVKRQTIPPVVPKEPEIKLKYVSAKPVRAESRARLFSPYVQVEKMSTFSTVCTIINTAGEESRLLKERSASHSGSHSVTFSNQGSLPFSSPMQLGPLVCKSVSSGCLLCCLCRCPANYKDLGDLCGPYYPTDCLPNKKPRLKDKLKPEMDKSLKDTDSLVAIGSGRSSCTDGSVAEAVKPNTLRSSTRGMLRKLPSCYCCTKKLGSTETEKPKRHQCGKITETPSTEPETQEHWVHEACAVWTSGVYLVAGKLYGINEAIQMASGLCPKCQKPGATVGCNHKGCVQSYHYTCAMESGCLLDEDNFSLRCPKHKRHLV